VENFTYDPQSDTVRILLDLKENHRGTKDMHGGIIAFMVDAASGALAFTKANEDEYPVTESNFIEYISRAVFGKGPVRAVSRLAKRTGRKCTITTTLYQGDKVVAIGTSIVSLVSAKTLERLDRKKASST